MKKYALVFFLITCINPLAFAQNLPLRVAIPSFAPPFVMQDSVNQYYGFDIATMEYICRTLNRSCEYLPMKSNELIPALQAQQVDIAIGGIVMTAQNIRRIRFSTPYMISQAQFMTTAQVPFTSPFQIKQLSNKRIGVVNGSAFEEAVSKMRINNARLITFERDGDMLDALRANTIDVALLSRLQANYWQIHSSNILKNIGPSFPIGLGFSIAIAPNKMILTNILNAALIQYQESQDYKQNYHLYFSENF